MDSISSKPRMNEYTDRAPAGAPAGEEGGEPRVIASFETYETHSEQFSLGDRIKDFCKNHKGDIAKTAVRTAVGAAIGAGAIALSGGSVLAAIGLSTAFSAAAGVVKGLGHAFLGSLNIGGHSGSSSAIDRNPLVMGLLMGGVGTAKGAAEGLVLGTLLKIGFGPLGGAVAGAVMPSLEKAGWHLFEKFQNRNAHHHLD